MTDPIIQRIESFRCRRGQLVAERRNRGYTLYRAGSGTPIARLRPDRTERSCRGALLVAMEGTLDQRRAVRAHHPAHRRGPAVHRFRGHLLGRGITGEVVKMRKVELRARSKAPIARSKSARASRMPAAASEEPAPSPRQRRKSRYRPAGTPTRRRPRCRQPKQPSGRTKLRSVRERISLVSGTSRWITPMTRPIARVQAMPPTSEIRAVPSRDLSPSFNPSATPEIGPSSIATTMAPITTAALPANNP